MKLEAMYSNDALLANDFRNRLREEKHPEHIRGCLPLRSLRVGAAAGREYLRGLRAAEMEAWNLSGGDCLLSRCATPVTTPLR
jgi:hypothetical protein